MDLAEVFQVVRAFAIVACGGLSAAVLVSMEDVLLLATVLYPLPIIFAGVQIRS